MSSKQFEYPSSSSESEDFSSGSDNESYSDDEKCSYAIHPNPSLSIKRDFTKKKEMKNKKYFVHNFQVKK